MSSLFYILTLVLSHLFSDHAVLQQQTQAPVWGWGDPGKKVEVVWDGQTYRTTVQADGSWRVSIPTGQADGATYTLTVKSGKETLTVKDIVLGEVWICSGQSNMEMPVSGFGFQEVEGATEAIMAAPETASQVRVFDIKTPKCTEPQADVDAAWAYTDGAVTAKTSAVGYFFARRLTRSLGVPVGIIVNAWGGSRIEPWMTREIIDGAGLTEQELKDLYAVQEQPDRWPETPELIWNGRVKPIVGYAAKGILWYQGCSNMGQPHCYDKLQKAMVQMWRKEWGRELPFIFTLLAPHDHGDADGRWRPFFVENQLHTEEILSQSFAICTETLGNKVTVHPSQKKEVADMMVQRALQNVYGIYSGVSIELPRLQSVEYLEDGTAKVTLTQVWSNLMSISAREIVGFELAGEDRQFHLAKAEVDWDGNTILVSCPEVPKPVAVRYGWRNWMGANLQKSNGIPVPPFRSDDWEY
ncbi:MAG: sialate O-acetylesterase [Bacteroidales bacterium]|nr:sialate O-acetylesterase [Bacteroidales bacterium]